MYAIIEVGAKQFNVQKGDIIQVEKQDIKPGKEINIKEVLLVSKDKKVEIGQPFVKEFKVVATVLEQTKGPKVISYKYRRRKNSHWKKGHRQKLTVLKIKDIELA